MTSQEQFENKALVAVFDNIASAASAIIALRKLGFNEQSLELVSHDIDGESPNLMSPSGGDITGSCFAESAASGGAAGAGMGTIAAAIATLATGFPGLGLGMIFGAGLTGALIGGMAGIDRAVHDDSVNLPSIDDYKALIEEGMKLVVVQGNHDQLTAAREAISNLPLIHSHLHVIQGHQFHEHPSSE